MLDLAIVGGGPGGLMSAWYLKKKLGDLCRVTIYEASDRVGGKILSRKFNSAPALYEAGVAEIYDYSMSGPGSAARTDPAFRPADDSDGRRAGAARRRTARRRAGHAPQIWREDRRRDRGVPQALLRPGVADRILRRRRRARQRASLGLHDLRGSARQGSRRCHGEALPQGHGAIGHRDREPQHQRAECAEELRDGYRRLYRPVFDPERQRATDRVPSLRGRCRHPAQSSRAQGRQDRGRPLPARHDEREGAGDARFRSGADVPAAFLARDHALGRRRAAQVDGQARRLFRPAGALPAGLDPVRRAVLGRADTGRLVHVGSVRRLLRLQRRRAP